MLKRCPQECYRGLPASSTAVAGRVKGLVDTTRPVILILVRAGSGACRGPRGERQQSCYRQACPKGTGFFRSPSTLSHFHLIDTPRLIGAREGARQMKNVTAFAVIATVGLVFVLPTQAQAATDLFLTWPGIVGPSTVQGHVGDIELLSYSQTASNTANPDAGGGGAGKSTCGKITITKRIDSTSPVFLGMVLSGRVTAGPVTVTFAKSGNERDTTSYTVRLRDVVPTSITQSDSPGADTIIETIVLAARQFVFTFTPQLPNGSFGTPVSFGWDCATNRQL
jgi:type VI secretion system secreted protein Hcp